MYGAKFAISESLLWLQCQINFQWVGYYNIFAIITEICTIILKNNYVFCSTNLTASWEVSHSPHVLNVVCLGQDHKRGFSYRFQQGL